MAMNDNIKQLIRKAVENMLEKNSSPAKIGDIQKKHSAKLHFIPFQYRVFGGLLQSLNIQFGNFIEEMMHLIIENDPNVEIIAEFSGKKNIKMPLSVATDAMIDAYISKCQTNPHINLASAFTDLRNQIIKSEIIANNKLITKHDIDLLFKDKKTNIIYYVEVKYNDDHDTGKFVDINRKFIKTYAALLNVIDGLNEKILSLYYIFSTQKE
jgi:hypothetical protein